MKRGGQQGKQKSAKQPLKNGQGQKGRAHKKQNSELDEVRAKQDLLQQLTKQAEENSRILERERAMVLAMEIQTLERDHRQAIENGTADQLLPFFEQPTYAANHYYGGALHPPPETQEQNAPQQQQYSSPQYLVGQYQSDHQGFAHHQPSHQPPAMARNNPNRTHNFMHQPTRVIDRAHVPGLGDPEPVTPEPTSPFYGHDKAQNSPHGPRTFPDSPGFLKPGMVFQIPSQASEVPVQPPITHVNQHAKVAAPAAKPRNIRPGRGGPGQTKQPKPDKHDVRPSDQRAVRKHKPPQQPTDQVDKHVVYEYPEEIYQDGYQAHELSGLEMPQADHVDINVANIETVQEPELAPGLFRPPPANTREVQQARQQAYRLELEEQIRCNAERKAAEAEARKRAEVAAEIAAAQSIPPWDPSAPRRGGGGDPHRDVSGIPVADLRYRADYVSQQAHDLHPEASRPQLRIQLPCEQPSQQQMHQLHNQQVDNPMTVQPPHNGWNGAPQAHAMAGPRGSMPGDVQISPGGRQFLGAVNQLLAGPSEEQRAHREAQRAALIRDLDEQVRQKREAGARKRAEEEAAIRKEEQELAEHYARLRMDREAEVAAQQQQQQHQQQQQQQHMHAVHRNSAVALAAEHSQPDAGNNNRHNRPGAKKKLIDADWLPAPGALQHQNQRGLVAGAVNPRSSLVAMTNQRSSVAGLANNPQTSTSTLHLPPVPVGLLRKARRSQDSALIAEHSNLLGNEASQPTLGVGAQRARHLSPRPDYTAQEKTEQPHMTGAAGGAGGPAGIDSVASALRMLQLEQKQLREEFSHHAASLQQLAVHANAVAEDRHQAWRDVQRVKQALAGGKHAPQDRPTQGGGQQTQPPTEHSAFLSSGQFVVSTHLLPREANNIPTRLPTPIEAEWAAAREPLLAHCKPAWANQEQEIRLRESLLHNSDLCDDDDLCENNDQLFSHHAGGHLSTLQESNALVDEHKGLFRPVSRVVGRPSMIPKPPSASAMHQFQGMPYIGFNASAQDGGYSWQPAHAHLDESYTLQTCQQLPAVRTNMTGMHTGRPPASPPILRADLLRRSPDRKVRQPRSAAPTVMRTRGRQVSAQPALQTGLPPGRGALTRKAVQPQPSKGQQSSKASESETMPDAVITRPSREGQQRPDVNAPGSEKVIAAILDTASVVQTVPSAVELGTVDE